MILKQLNKKSLGGGRATCNAFNDEIGQLLVIFDNFFVEFEDKELTSSLVIKCSGKNRILEHFFISPFYFVMLCKTFEKDSKLIQKSKGTY
jgi:hypothetical protein